MEISFQSHRLERRFISERQLRRAYGPQMARAILARVRTLSGAGSLEMIPRTPPERLHQLEGQRQFQFTVDLTQPYRLVFRPANDPVPLREDGGIDLERVTEITIIGVIDYH